MPDASKYGIIQLGIESPKPQQKRYFNRREINMPKQTSSEYKDRVFKWLFGTEENKDNILSLYNALNSSNYTNPDDIEINTIEGILYLGMKNDVSFLIDDHMILWEQQSSFNPNMPYRGFKYIGQLYESYILSHNLKDKLYGRNIVKLPTPKFIVFYNGEEDKDSVIKLRMSDAFIHPDKSGDFEWTATMYNLNKGKNDELLAKCKPLADYMTLVNYVREYVAQGYLSKEVIDKAVERCINEGVLKEFLLKHWSEVRDMLFTEFDQEGYKKVVHEEGYEEGRQEGREEGISVGKLEAMLDLVNSGDLTREVAVRKSGLTEAEFDRALEDYRKGKM